MTLSRNARSKVGRTSLPLTDVEQPLDQVQGTDIGNCVRDVTLSSTFLRPLAPRALPRFRATMDALTPERRFFVPKLTGNELRPARSGLLASCDRTFWPFHLQPPLVVPGPGLVSSRGLTAAAPLSCTHSCRVAHSVNWASPFPSRLATTTGRIEFVILWTSRSPPVALHPASRRRSYVRLQSSNPTLARTLTSLIQSTYKRTRERPLRRSEQRADGTPRRAFPTVLMLFA